MYNHAKNVRSRAQPAGKGKGPGPSAQAQAPVVSALEKKHRNAPLCRTSHYQPPGSNKVGLGKDNQPSKVVWELDYGLSEKQFKSLSERFPGVAFVQTGFDCHDHPIAHTSYRIVWENVVRKIKPGSKVADVAGNPAYNEQFNKRQVGRDKPITIDTFCKVLSTKDSVRSKVRWGPPVVDGKTRWEEMTLYDMYRNEGNRMRFATYDVFLMNHSLYYYTKSEVTKLLALNPNAVIYATLHKLQGQNGLINCGEQQYEKDFVTGRVKQTNVDTGEYYEHPDPAPWFRNFCYADSSGAIAWTINKGCDDTYVVTITSTETRLVPEDAWLNGTIIHRKEKEVLHIAQNVAADPPPAYTVEEVEIKSSDLLPSYDAQKTVKVQITHPELYDMLKHYMINKPRNHKTLQDLTAKAHREVGNNVYVGGVKRVKIKPEALNRHIFAAWMAGAEEEAHMFESLVCSNLAAGHVNRNLAGKTLSVGNANMIKQALRAALVFSATARSKDPVHEVLAQFDELL